MNLIACNDNNCFKLTKVEIFANFTYSISKKYLFNAQEKNKDQFSTKEDGLKIEISKINFKVLNLKFPKAILSFIYKNEAHIIKIKSLFATN